MNEKQLLTTKWYFIGLVSLITWSILIWQYLHEGVPSHHLLNRSDLPAISNWWGSVLLPVLSWIMLGRIQKRLLQTSPAQTSLCLKHSYIGFLLAFMYGVMLSLTFFNGYAHISSIIFPGILLFAIFFKVYREEFVLGFILSMSFGFGAVLPTIFATIIALASAIVYFSVQFVWSKVRVIAFKN